MLERLKNLGFWIARLARYWSVAPAKLEELSIQASLLQAIFESVEDGLLVLDTRGLILHCNEGMLSILGLEKAGQVKGKPWKKLWDMQDNYRKLRGVFAPGLAQDQVVELEIGGLKRIFTARWREVLDDTGGKAGTLYLLQDVTEKRQRERLKNEFLEVLSHEIKTPLQSLGTAAELLVRRKEQMDEDSRMLVDTVFDDANRIREVANDLIQASLVDLRAMRFKIERVALSRLLPEWLKPFRVLARERGVNVEYVQAGPEVIWANVDPAKFPWAVSNLLANALRVSPKGGRLGVKLEEQGQAVAIEITDQGPGVPEELRRRIFEPHFQGPAAGLLGLGLSIASEVAEAHQGGIECLANTEQGSCFRITLPPAPPLEGAL